MLDSKLKQLTRAAVMALGAAVLPACGGVAEEPPVQLVTEVVESGLVSAQCAYECADNCYAWCCTTQVCDARTVEFNDGCCMGRPLVVDGLARVADVETNDDWA